MIALRRWLLLLGTQTWVQWKWQDEIGLVAGDRTRVVRHRGHVHYWWRAR